MLRCRPGRSRACGSSSSVAIGPGPHAAMLLADLGADVVRIERPDAVLRVGEGEQHDQMLRRRRLRRARPEDQAEGLAQLLALIDRADVVIDGFRPGVAERMGLGPDVDLRDRNPRLIFGRITGWGQDWSARADRGARHQLHRADRRARARSPARASRRRAPLNLVADFGGGSLYLVVGVLRH